MDNLHKIQMDIIKTLSFSPFISFSKLNTSSIESDKFSYHLKKLIKEKLIAKSDKDKYSLTDKGKMYVSHMDTATKKIEQLPKSSVLIIPIKQTNKSKKYLIHTRQKEPYYGYSGFITGKIRFGETVEEAAARELKEESGVTGLEYKHHFVIHEMVYNKSGKQLEDKFFNIVSFASTKGHLLSKTEEGKNQWITEEEFRKMHPLFHNELDILGWYLAGRSTFLEEKYYIEEY